MKKICKNLLTITLVVAMLFGSTLQIFAADQEEYICELRLIYADDYDEALEIIGESSFEGYKVLNENLNEDSGEVGVWLAYKVTTNIEDAITDIAVMQMDGGYSEGNYQEMIKKSYEEYVAMGEIYVDALEYFAEAYDAKNFLTIMAYRQLNLYTSITDETLGIEIPHFDGELLGDVFYNGIDAAELATMFLEGNSYALRNIRSLISMGVAYNEDGKTYLEKVGDSAAEMIADPNVYADEDYDELAALIAPTINTFRDMFKELSAYESELNYADDDVTEDEIRYAEYKAIAEMTRDVNYLNGKTLYDFCLNFKENNEDYSALYPLVDALNDGQLAMTKVAHYYDVVRYSAKSAPEEILEEEIGKLEEEYGEYPFNIYTGTDRSIYRGTFALTTAAYRADAYNDKYTFADTLFSEDNAVITSTGIISGIAGLGCMYWAAMEKVTEGIALSAKINTVNNAVSLAEQNLINTINSVANSSVVNFGSYAGQTSNDVLTSLINIYFAGDPTVNVAAMSFADKFQFLDAALTKNSALFYSKTTNMASITGATDCKIAWTKVKMDVDAVSADAGASAKSCQTAAEQTTQNAAATSSISGILYIVGGALMLYSAIMLGLSVYNYYNPDYSDIPLSLVDLVDTIDGDRYIKYDVVLEAEPKDDGVYAAGDLNAFEGQRWNALYYTKSYEAGKPLLADTFTVSHKNNTPKDNYAPVHRFGEVVCYDLNKYNFDDDTSIYLSVKRSKKNKAAVESVPEVIGSVFGTGTILIAGGIGAIVGIGATLATTGMMKKKPKKDNSDEDTANT